MMYKNEDHILSMRIKQGDEKAFKTLFDTYYTSLCRFANIYLYDYWKCEEIILDIFMTIWVHRASISIKQSFKSYLFKAAKNRILNVLRDTRFSAVSMDQLPADIASTIESSLESEQLQHIIIEAICALPPRCKEVFQLSREGELSNKEIAVQLGISIKTVEAQMSKAIRIIKSKLDHLYLLFF